jgi:hypothetical protein
MTPRINLVPGNVGLLSELEAVSMVAIGAFVSLWPAQPGWSGVRSVCMLQGGRT